jgi:hypothetical protein
LPKKGHSFSGYAGTVTRAAELAGTGVGNFFRSKRMKKSPASKGGAVTGGTRRLNNLHSEQLTENRNNRM